MLRKLALRMTRHPRIHRLVPVGLLWHLELPDEVAWWDEWMRTKGLSWPQGFETRLDRELELQSVLCQHLDTPDGDNAEILDVASGPMTWVGKRWGARQIHITPVDVLAPMYDKLLSKHQLTPSSEPATQRLSD